MQPVAFQFRDPGTLIEGNLHLILEERFPGDPSKNWVPAYRFRMCLIGDPSEQKIGRVEFRVGNTHDLVMYGGHFAYEVDPSFRGQRYAERACRLLLPLAKAHGFNELWITCNPNNWPSRRTCERLGAELIEIVPLPEHIDMYQAGEREKCRYRLILSR